MRKLFIIPIFLFTFTLIKTSNILYSEENKPIAIISATAGKVTILNKNGNFIRNAARLTKVFADEIVSTGHGSSCTVVFRDRTSVKLDGDTKVLLSKVNVDAKSRRGIGVLQGGVDVAVFKTGKGSFTAFTPTAVAGVRGTTFRVQVASDGSSRCQVEEGNVNFSSGSQAQDLTAGNYGTQELDGNLNRGNSSNNADTDNRNWQRQREENLRRDPAGTLEKLETEVRQIEQNNQRAVERVRNLQSSQINRDNAGQVVEVDNEVVENSARNRAIRETSNNIASRYRNNRGVAQRHNNIIRHTSAVEQQINMMDKFIEEMGRKVDQLIERQEEQIDDLMNNFMRRGLRRQ